jgi:hypothetical protein
MMKWTVTLMLAFYVCSCSPNHAGPVHAKASPQGGQLIELFTSQGCSNCPPAETWIGQLTTHQDLWTRFVPVVFHVDYWDRLGWKDPFASQQHTKRQYQYRAYHQLPNVYTPGFFVDGREWKGFFQRGPLPSIRETNTKIAATWNAGKVSVKTTGLKENHVIHAAVLGFDLKTSVKQGENAGRKLRGNFVVLSHRSIHVSTDTKETSKIEFQSIDLAAEAPRYGFAVWVTPSDSPLPIGATGNWLPKALFRSE